MSIEFSENFFIDIKERHLKYSSKERAIILSGKVSQNYKKSLHVIYKNTKLTNIFIGMRIYEKRNLEKGAIGKVSFVKPFDFDEGTNTKCDISIDVVVLPSVFDGLKECFLRGVQFNHVSISTENLSSSDDGTGGDVVWDTTKSGHDLIVEDITIGVAEEGSKDNINGLFEEVNEKIEKIYKKIGDGVKLKVFG